MTNNDILQKANAEIDRGNIEGFLAFCADDIVWTSVGEKPIRGKDALRRWMATAYAEPPTFTVTHSIAEGDHLAVLGDIMVKGDDGKAVRNAYCDVWRFRDGQMVELQAFVIEPAAY